MSTASTEAIVETGATGATGSSAAATSAEGTTAAGEGATGAAAAATQATAADAKAKPWEDPEAAEAEILRLRKENAKDRTDAKTKAAEDAKKELAQTIGKALGLVEDEQIDPAVLTENLTTAQAEAKRARVELAVFRNADTSKGDPIALLDSTSFLASLEAIDPTDNEAISAAIAAAVAANPRLGAATGTRVPAPNRGQGSSAAGTPDAEALMAEAAKRGDWQSYIAMQNQKLVKPQ